MNLPLTTASFILAALLGAAPAFAEPAAPAKPAYPVAQAAPAATMSAAPTSMLVTESTPAPSTAASSLSATGQTSPASDSVDMGKSAEADVAHTPEKETPTPATKPVAAKPHGR